MIKQLDNLTKYTKLIKNTYYLYYLVLQFLDRFDIFSKVRWIGPPPWYELIWEGRERSPPPPPQCFVLVLCLNKLKVGQESIQNWFSKGVLTVEKNGVSTTFYTMRSHGIILFTLGFQIFVPCYCRRLTPMVIISSYFGFIQIGP